MLIKSAWKAEKVLTRWRRTAGFIPLAPITTAAAIGEGPNNEPLIHTQDAQMITDGTPLTDSARPLAKGKSAPILGS